MKSKCGMVAIAIAAYVILIEKVWCGGYPYERVTIDQINSYLTSHGNGALRVSGIVVIDSLVGTSKEGREYFEDPYGTLAHCVPFIACPDDNLTRNEWDRIYYVGVWKSSMVAWLSDSISAQSGLTAVVGSRDINLDGSVDMIVLSEDFDHDGDGFESMEIFSWNGASAVGIVDTSGGSSMVALAKTLDLADLDGDGVLEVRGIDSHNQPVVWGWNGSKYVDKSKTMSFSPSAYLPAKASQVDVKCLVSVVGAGRQSYSYSLSSRSTSKRRVEKFMVEHSSTDTVGTAPSTYYFAGARADALVAWCQSPSLLATGMLAPGQQLSGFSLTSTGLPRVRSYLIQSERATPYLDSNGVAIEPLAAIYQNSFLGKTSVPADPDDHGNGIACVDTLINNTNVARALGWITSQPALAKYTNMLMRTKSDLQSANPASAKTRLDSIITQSKADSGATLSSEAWAILYFNSDYLRTKLTPSREIALGATISGSGTISVRARAASGFLTTDSLVQTTATLRWLSASSITLGPVSSPIYGFSKLDAPVTAGAYTYQKFRTTMHKSVPWNSGIEYELFTAPINNPTGLEQVELTNSLAGGEGFVDINYLDKTDSVFYQPLAQGYVYSNKSSSGGATAYNHGRHIAVSGTKFHEVYENVGEIVYRKKDLSTGAWEATSRISTGNGSNNDANIIVASNGYLYAVWQHYLTASTYNVSWARSTDGGATWTNYPILSGTGTVTVSSSQLNTFPVVAQYSTTQILVVYCTSNGLFFVKSLDNGVSWSAPAQVPTVGTLSTIWFPSIAKGTNYLILTYDTRTSGVYSTKYNGTSWWSTAANISSGIGTIYDRYSSIVVDASNVPMAAWCAQRSGRSEYRIVFRLANTGGDTWSSTYTEWTQRPAGISDYYPSMNAYQAPGNLSYREVLWHSSDNQVGLQQWTMGNWTASNLSTTGLWPSTAAGSSVRVWTDQSASPYEVKRSSMDGTLQLQSIVAGASSVQNEKRVTLESESSGSFVSFELTPLKIVSSKGDTTELSFKAIDQATAITLTESQSWDFIGTDNVVLPANAKYLVFDADIQNVTRQDSTGKKSFSNAFTGRAFTVSVVKGGQKTQVFSDNTAQSGRKVIDISAFAGQTVAIRPAGTATRKTGEVITVGVGNIFAPRR